MASTPPSAATTNHSIVAARLLEIQHGLLELSKAKPQRTEIVVTLATALVNVRRALEPFNVARQAIADAQPSRTEYTEEAEFDKATADWNKRGNELLITKYEFISPAPLATDKLANFKDTPDAVAVAICGWLFGIGTVE